MTDFDVIFQVTIRYLKPPQNADPVEYALKSLGLDDIAISIYRILAESNIATPQELSRILGIDEETIIDRLDQMYSLGLIDKLGRAYIRDLDLSQAIKKRVLKRIEHLLDFIAEIAKGVRNDG